MQRYLSLLVFAGLLGCTSQPSKEVQRQLVPMAPRQVIIPDADGRSRTITVLEPAPPRLPGVAPPVPAHLPVAEPNFVPPVLAGGFIPVVPKPKDD